MIIAANPIAIARIAILTTGFEKVNLLPESILRAMNDSNAIKSAQTYTIEGFNQPVLFAGIHYICVLAK